MTTMELQEIDRLHGSDTAVLQTLAAYETVETWPADKMLYAEGESPAGVYVLLSGEVDLVYASRAGATKPLRIASSGQILGLSCIVSARPHDCSATTRTRVITGFIPQARFLKLLDENPPLWFSVLQMISSEINSCYDCMRTLTATR